MGKHNPVCFGLKLILFGGLLIANDIYWNYSWASFFGALLIVKGLMSMLFARNCGCGHGEECCKPEEKKEGKKEEKKEEKKEKPKKKK